MEAISNDFYDIIKPEFLIKQYYRALEIKSQLMDFIATNQYKTEFFEEFRDDVTSWMRQTSEKEVTIANKIRNLTKQLGYSNFHDMQSRCEKILQNLDKANDIVNSRMVSMIQSYDYRDNEYY